MKGKRLKFWSILVSAALALAVLVGYVAAAPSPQATPVSLARGGKLYDKWWTAAPGVAEPKGDHALWSLQTTNTRKGLDTYRCKECHGWDYSGKDGVYGSGSHKTGFVGVNGAATKTKEQLVGILKGAANPKHDFSASLNAEALGNLADFIKEGLIDTTKYIDNATKKPKSANLDHGKQLYSGTCAACHGDDGRKLNFGSENQPEYVGTLAVDNPWEFLHKVRVGQPGTPMPSGFEMGWKVEDAVDVLAHAQTLPVGKAQTVQPVQPAQPAQPTLPKTGGPILPIGLAAIAGVMVMGLGLVIRRIAVR